MTITSAYGPNSEPDEEWLSATCSHHDASTQKTIVYVGDFNWRKSYDCLTHDLHHGPPTCTTTQNTAPTRILANRPISCVESMPMPGIPHHYLVTYDIEDGLDISDQGDSDPSLRPRRCAHYRWTLRDEDEDEMVLINEHHALETELNQTVPLVSSEASLAQRWHNWHARCETRFQIAERLGYTTTLRPAERTKGLLSFSETFKKVGNRPPHFQNQSLANRRLRRVHRAITDRLYHADADDQPPPRDSRRLQQLVSDGLLPENAHISTIGDAITTLSQAISAEDQKEARFRSKIFQDKIAQSARMPWKEVNQCLKPTPPPTCTSEQMRQQFAELWAPTDHDPNDDTFADNWTNYASASPPPANDVDHDLPTIADLHDELIKAKGACGLDGWTSQEARDLARYFRSPSTSSTNSGSKPPPQPPQPGPTQPTPMAKTRASTTKSTGYA